MTFAPVKWQSAENNTRPLDSSTIRLSEKKGNTAEPKGPDIICFRIALALCLSTLAAYVRTFVTLPFQLIESAYIELHQDNSLWFDANELKQFDEVNLVGGKHFKLLVQRQTQSHLLHALAVALPSSLFTPQRCYEVAFTDGPMQPLKQRGSRIILDVQEGWHSVTVRFRNYRETKPIYVSNGSQVTLCIRPLVWREMMLGLLLSLIVVNTLVILVSGVSFLQLLAPFSLLLLVLYYLFSHRSARTFSIVSKDQQESSWRMHRETPSRFAA